MKGLREEEVSNLEQANRYLEQVYEPWWEAACTVHPADPDDAHRPLGKEHAWASILSRVEMRPVHRDYTVQFQGSQYRIAYGDIVAGLRGAAVRPEQRLDGGLALSFQGRRLRFELCAAAVKMTPPPVPDRPSKTRRPTMNSQRTPWGENYDRLKDIPIWKAAQARG